MKAFYYLRRYSEISRLEKILIIRTFIITIFVRSLVNYIPLKYYLSILKSEPRYIRSDEEKEYLLDIAYKCIRRMRKIFPWHRNCLVKSLVLKLVLNSLGIGSKITLSISKSKPETLNAHAFLKVSKFKSFFEIKGFHEIITISK
jgi:hypothetical protein